MFEQKLQLKDSASGSAEAEADSRPSPLPSTLRPYVHGKFIFADDEKLYLRGVTYGTFAPTRESLSEYNPVKVARDFALMAENGINTVRVYTVPPRWLLDAAERYGLRVMVGLPWEQHIAFLDNQKTVKSIETRIRAGVRSCANHPAVLCRTISAGDRNG